LLGGCFDFTERQRLLKEDKFVERKKLGGWVFSDLLLYHLTMKTTCYDSHQTSPMYCIWDLHIYTLCYRI